MRPQLRAVPRRSARSSTPLRAPDRRAWAAPSPPPAPSAPGTGGRARRSCSCRDQRVVAGKRTELDLDLGAAPALAAQPVELLLVGGVGDGQVAREAAPVTAGELAAVERDRRDLGLAGAHLDAPAR